MEQSGKLTGTPAKTYVKAAITVILILFAGKFVVKDALPYFGLDQEQFGRYWDVKWLLVGHISGGIVALAMGPFQFSKAFRNRYLNTHRWMGRIYLMAILVSVVFSTILAWTSSIKVNFSWALSLQMLAVAWFLTSGMAYLSVLKKRMIQHREWMIRSYIVTFGFVSFRFLNDSAFAYDLMNKFEERGPTIVWFCWTIPLLLAEVIMSWKRNK